MSSVDVWKLLGGLGLFLFGMDQLEEAIRSLTSKYLRKWLGTFTKDRFRSVTTGMLVTGVLQSSSAVSLITLALVGAGLMKLTQAIGVILGSNIGSTFTGWIVAALGFRLDIESITLPILALAGIGLLFSENNPRLNYFSRLLAGFALLFLGLDFIKQGTEHLSQFLPFDRVNTYGRWEAALLGFVATAVIRSSAAVIAIVLSFVNAGIIEMPVAIAIVVGSDLGTTTTAILGALGGSETKKRVALSHFLFNLFSSTLFLLLLPILLPVILGPLASGNDPVMAIPIFHTLYNVAGVLLFIPFINPFAELLRRLVPKRRSQVTFYIHTVKPDIPETALVALKKEINHLIHRVMDHNLALLGMGGLPELRPDDEVEFPLPNHIPPEMKYEQIKELQNELYKFASGIQVGSLQKGESGQLNRSLQSVRHAVNCAKVMKDARHNLQELEFSDKKFVSEQLARFANRSKQIYLLADELLNEKEHDKVMPGLHQLVSRLGEAETVFTDNFTHAISTKEIKSENISSLLSVHRAHFLSAQHLINALEDLLLDAPEANVLEQLQAKQP